MTTRTYSILASLILALFCGTLWACDPQPPMLTGASNVTQSANVGQTLTFNGENVFYCPDGGTIDEYQWVLPDGAFFVTGSHTKTLECKFSPAGVYTVELRVKCSHELWNIPTEEGYTVTVTASSSSGPWYVSPNGNDDNDGLSSSGVSPAGPFRTIQTAIDSAIDGQEIIVEAGDSTTPAVYYEQINVKGKNLNIHSTDPEDWEAVQNTIIDANKQGTTVRYGGAESNSAELKGFTVRGGFPTGDSLALHLEFNDPNTIALDSSGKERNGTVNGDPTLVSGRLGGSDQAIQFTGDDFIQIEDYKGVSGNHARSCALWVKTSTVNTEMVLMSWGKGVTGQKWQLLINDSNYLGIGIWGGRIDGTQTILTDGNWHHIAVVFGGNGAINLQDIKLYIDGIQEATTCFNYVTTPPDVNTELDGHVYIGKRTESPASCYIGILDDVRIYSRTLSEAEIGDIAFDCILPVHLKLDGNASNAAGDQYHGTVEGNPSWISSGRILGALDLDGDGDYVTLPSGILNPAEMSFSIFAWVRPDQQTISSYQTIIQQVDEGGNVGRTLLWRGADNKLSSSFGGYTTTSSQAIFTQAGQWYHVGITYGGREVSLYVNGQKVASAFITAEPCNGGLIIGRHKTSTSTYWNGAVDDLRIYKGVIGPDEIQRIFTHEDAIAHWTLDTISGNTIADSSLYNRSGTFSVTSPTSTCSDGRLDNAISIQNNEYIRISGWNGIAGGNSRTTTAWVKTTPIPTASQMVCTWGNSANGEKWMFRVETTGQIALGVWGGSVSGTTIVADGNWHHVAAVLNSDGTPTVGEVQLYVDGRLETVTSTTPSQAIITSDAENVLIGTRHQNGSYYNYFTGRLDDVRIYDRALNQIQIQEMAANTGPIAHWTLDETSSPSADSSGNTISGTWNGTPTPSDEGYLSRAMEFDGVSDYISTNYSGVLGNRDRTVSAWIKTVPDNSLILRTIAAWGGVETGGSWNLAVNYISGEGPSGTIRIAANSSKVIGTTPVDDNRWHHVAAVFANDGTPTVSDIQLYIDGKREVLSYSVDATLNTGTGYNVNIGAMRYQTNDPIFFFKGKIDDVRIYDRALSDLELWQMYEQTVGGGIAGHGTSASIAKCIIKGNQSQVDGGGISFIAGMVKNTLLIDNQSGQNGGGIAYSSGTIQNCTLTNNFSISGGGLYGCNGDIVNSILWNNTPDQVVDCNDIRFSCIQNWNQGGTGNIAYNPCFTDPSQDNYSLLSYSPSIDAGCNILNDPASDYVNEPEDNGDRVNMGYLGNTTSAEIADRITDSDNDRLTDYQEILYGTNRLAFDSDGDGIPDGWEISNSLNPLDPNDAQLDSDADGLTNIQEYYYGTNPSDSDTDSDGMSDAWEIAHGLYALYSDDGAMDNDADGLTNLEEYVKGTNPCQKDSDDDGLDDGIEVQWDLNPVDPNDASYDLDNDGYSNVTEYIHASDPNDPNSLCVPRTIVVPTEVTTIQKAVSWSIDGDKIVVLQGVYHENVVIEDKDIIVQSSDPNNPNVVKSTVIDGQGNWPLLLMNCGTSTKISGLTLQNGNYGVWVSNGDSTIEKCIIQHNSSFGVYLQNQSAPLISHNIIHLNGEIGVLSEASCSPAIRNNLIYGNTYGISLIDAGGAKISNNTIFNNKAYGIISVGTAPLSKNNIIWNNTNDLVSCPTIYSCISDQDAGIGNIFEDPNFINVFDFVDKTTATGTQVTICVADASRYAVGDVIEYNDDNISRIVTDVNSLTNTVAFSNHPMDANSVSDIYVFNWGYELQALNEDFHIQMNSPCIDAGDPNDNYAGQWDIDQEPRMRGENVDIGADETPVVWYVDHDADGLNTGYSWQDAFPSIQQAINVAMKSDIILIASGVYKESVDLRGKEITLSGTAPEDIAIVKSTMIYPDSSTIGIKIYSGETSKSVIRGLAVRSTGTGIYINSSNPTIEQCWISNNGGDGIYIHDGNPTITKCTIEENDKNGIYYYLSSASGGVSNCIISYNKGHGIEGGSAFLCNNTIVGNSEYGVNNSTGKVVNSIIWNNTKGSLSNCTASYCCLQNVNTGEGNISYYPYFVDIENDYHLLSYSPCIDMGDPNSAYKNELYGGGGRIDMGAFGNTREATIACLDADDDGLPDSWENLHWPNQNIELIVPDEDSDSDNLTNIQEYHLGLSPIRIDSDGDNLSDNDEIQNKTDPLNIDTDKDGMSDGWEIAYGLDPLKNTDAISDSDGDGLTNLQEFNTYSNPLKIDSDGDFIPDAIEVEKGLNPVDPNDADYDVDNDGYSNITEYIHGSDCGALENIPQAKKIIVPTEIPTITQAIEWSIDGDEIEVLPGEYNEYVAVDGKNIHLHSSDPNNWDVVKSTIIMNDYWLLLKDNNSNMLLEGITISNNQYGIWCSNSDATVRRCIIENSNRGIYCSNSSSGTIAENIIRSNAFYGVLVNSSTNPRIKNNVIYANGDGIHAAMAPDSSIINNTVYANVDNGISVVGIQPVINNNIVFNNGDDLNGCTATYSCISDGDSGVGNISFDPNFVNIFDFWDTTIADGSVATIIVADPNLYLAGDVIEYQNDGVVHIVTDVDMTSRVVSFDVPLYANSVSGAIIFNWGPSTINIEENFHLKPLSPCINAGDPNGYYYDQSDIDGDPRIRGVAVDIGADEASVIWYVDNDANGLKTGYSETDAVTCIQEAIGLARNGDTIVVYPGNYQENIDFKSKSIAIQSIAPGDWNIINQTEIEASDPNDPVVTFTKTEDANSILSGFTIKNGTPGIKCEENASPVITHCRVTENQGGGVIGYIDMLSNITSTTPTIENCVISDNNGYGVLCSRPSIINCTVVNNTGIGVKGTYGILVKNSIIWGNSYQIAVPSTYSCIQGDDSIDTNIGYFPYFSNPDVGDYTLFDYSPCIDAGDPNSAYKNEMNGGGGRINLGAYGNTSAATLASIDADADELPDTWELLFWTGDPNLCDPNADPDLDLLVNRIEYQIGTNPTDSDTDNDGIDDGWENANNLDPRDGNDASLDRDEDGLTNLQEYVYGTNPNSSDEDADGDGLPDAWEKKYWPQDNVSIHDPNDDPDIDTLNNLREYQIGTNPTDSDTDNDGIDDGWEYNHQLDPLNADDAAADKDSDGLTNLQEYIHGTDLNDSDSDNDGMYDGWEVNNGLNPLNSSDKETDLDADGYNNYIEYLHDSDPNNPSSALSNIQILVPTQSSTIQQAIDWSVNGDSVKILPGIYAESVNYNGKLITLTGIDPNDWTTIASTVIDGMVSAPAVGFISGENQSAVLEGLCIKSAQYGISCSNGSSPTIHRCIIEDNSSHGIFVSDGSPTISNCMIDKNGGSGYHLDSGNVNVKSCWIYRNSGSGISVVSSSGGLVGCNTIAKNTQYGVIFTGDPNDSNVMPPQIANNIIWDNGGSSYSDLQGCSAEYCCISDGGTGTNIDDNPLFFNANGDNYLLEKKSPCVDAGDPNAFCDSNEKDILGQVRMAGRIDMGADEVCAIHNITQNIWYVDSIQDAINGANDFDVIELYEWTYTENIDFSGKAITISGKKPYDWAVVNQTIIEGTDPNLAVVTFDTNEDANSILTGLTIKQTGESNAEAIYISSSPQIKRCIIEYAPVAIKCESGSPLIAQNKIRNNKKESGVAILVRETAVPTIRANMVYNNYIGIKLEEVENAVLVYNNTVVFNGFADPNEGIGYGISVDTNSTAPIIANMLLWGNDDDLNNCNATYSCLTNQDDVGDPNDHNISENPKLFNTEEDSFYLASDSPCLTIANAEIISENDVDLEGRPLVIAASSTETNVLCVTGENYTGSWRNDDNTFVFTYLQDALVKAKAGDEIWVKAGTYNPDQHESGVSKDQSETFELLVDVSMYGGFSGNEVNREERNAIANITVLSGDIGVINNIGDNSYHVLTVAGTNNKVTLDGFVIQKGYAKGVDHSSCDNYGGAIYVKNGSLDIKNCIIQNNHANGGGAVFNYGTFSADHCVFQNNSCQWEHEAATSYSGSGGALYNKSIMQLINCFVIENSAGCLGGGIYNEYGSLKLVNSLLVGNNAVGWWGMEEEICGGAILNSSDADIVNCTIYQNSGNKPGITNFSTLSVENSIIWDNSVELTKFGDAVVNCSDVKGGWSGTGSGNIDTDPQLSNTSNLIGADGVWGTRDDGLMLLETSPCKDAGDDNQVVGITNDITGLKRKLGQHVDMGAYEFWTDVDLYWFSRNWTKCLSG